MKHHVIMVGVLLAWGAHDAAAGGPEIVLSVKAPPAGSAASPAVEATIIGAPKVTADKISLSSTADPKIAIRASKLRDYAHGDEPIAIAFVVQGAEFWIGNDQVVTKDDPSRTPGALIGLAKAIDAARLVAAVPSGSKGLLITYGDKAAVRVPMGDLKLITGKALGSQKDYFGKTGSALVGGITLAVAELTKVSTARKALIVVGDGNDTNNDAAKAELAALRKQAVQQNIGLFALTYKTGLSGDGNVITGMVPRAQLLSSADELAAALAGIGTRIGDRYYVTFPGYDPKAKTGLAWDGKAADLVVTIDGKAADPVTLTLAPTWARPAK